MNQRSESSALAETAALRLRQRQIGRELRLLYEKLLREPLPDDMLDALIERDAREPAINTERAPSASGAEAGRLRRE